MRSQLKITTWITAIGLGAFLIAAQETTPTPEPPAPAKSKPKNASKTGKAPKTKKAPPTKPGTTGSDRYFLEQIRQLRGEMEELKGAYNLQIRKVMALETEVRTLRTANETLKRENALRFASNKSIDELAAKIMELDKNRLNDLDITNKQIDAILKTVKKLAAAPPATPRHNGNTTLRRPTSKRASMSSNPVNSSAPSLKPTTTPSRPRGYPVESPNHRSSRPTLD